MEYLFSPPGLKLLESLPLSPSLFAFDFDGTLAPIISDPAKARVPRKTAALLSNLSAKSPIAVISGRSVSDLRQRIGLKSVRLIGNHGLEGGTLRNAAARIAARTCRAWKGKILSWPLLRGKHGIVLEDKRFSLALHYRRSNARKSIEKELLRTISLLNPKPRLIPGKCVLNLIPNGTHHKGTALLEVMKQVRVSRALYVGDDDTDEDVFAISDERMITIRVGRREDSRARFFIKRRVEINRLLENLTRSGPWM